MIKHLVVALFLFCNIQGMENPTQQFESVFLKRLAHTVRVLASSAEHKIASEKILKKTTLLAQMKIPHTPLCAALDSLSASTGQRNYSQIISDFSTHPDSIEFSVCYDLCKKLANTEPLQKMITNKTHSSCSLSEALKTEIEHLGISFSDPINSALSHQSKVTLAMWISSFMQRNAHAKDSQAFVSIIIAKFLVTSCLEYFHESDEDILRKEKIAASHVDKQLEHDCKIS